MRKSYKGYDDFTAALVLAKQSAVAAYGLHWTLVRGASARCRVPAPWTACKVFGRVSKSPRDMRIPAARFWPSGQLPMGPEYFAEYAWHVAPVALPVVKPRQLWQEISVIHEYGLEQRLSEPVRCF